MSSTRRALPVLLALLAGTLPTPAQELPAYEPHPVPLPKDQMYLTDSGAIMQVGNDGMAAIVTQWNELFVETHAGFKFWPLLDGSSTGIPGLTAGVSAMAPMARNATAGEIAGFKDRFGYLPLDVHIGYSGFGPRPAGKNPPGLYVNAKNPIPGLTMTQAAQIYFPDQRSSTIPTWGKLGLTGEWADKPIHLYGANAGGVLDAIQLFAGNWPVNTAIEPIKGYEKILKALAADPYGIAVTGWFDASDNKDVKLLPLTRNAGEPFVLPTYENVHAGKYPISVPLRFYVNRMPGQRLEPVVKEYLRMVLSREGQAIIAAQRNSEEGYVPLAPALVKDELAKLE